MLKALKVDELVPGMMVTQVLEQHGPVKIRKVGFIRSADMIRGLTEMGVTKVEVDIGQSLNVEPDDEQNDVAATSSDAATSVKSTATQRLVVSDRQIAHVDRQLSQQFHRSLFLPTVDQMPSKWMLYGKPYALLLVVVVAGLVGGAMASYTISAMLTSKEPAVVSISNGVGDAAVNKPQGSALPSAAPSSLGEQKSQASTDSSIKEEVASTNQPSSELAAVTAQNEQAPAKLESGATQTANEAVQAISENETASAPRRDASESSSAERASTASPTINGVTLEAGQQVFGYQSGVDDEDQASVTEPAARSRSAGNQGQSSQTSSMGEQGTDTNERLNSALLRRIQAAADDVDGQMGSPEPEPLRVTDLNTLPRIDQLSPAMLTQMPAMSFSAHMYASNPRDRWVRVNSRRLGEGDTIANDVILKRIESEKVVLEYSGTEFTMNALSDW